MNTPPIVSQQEWEAARAQLLVKEKELTRRRDALAAERRRMPWLAVDKDYALRGPRRRGEPARPVRRPPAADRLPRLLRARRRGWPEHGCLGCSFVADQVAHLAHLNARDTTLAFASRAPQADIERFKERMGWESPLVHDHRRLRRRLRRRRVARHQRLHPRRRPDLPHLLHRQPRRRGDGQHLELPRHHRARPPGGVGGLAGGLPADAAVRVVGLARRRGLRPPVAEFERQIARGLAASAPGSDDRPRRRRPVEEALLPLVAYVGAGLSVRAHLDRVARAAEAPHVRRGR